MCSSYYTSPFRLAFYHLSAASRRLLSYWDIFTYQLDVAFALYWDFPAGLLLLFDFSFNPKHWSYSSIFRLLLFGPVSESGSRISLLGASGESR